MEGMMVSDRQKQSLAAGVIMVDIFMITVDNTLGYTLYIFLANDMKSNHVLALRPTAYIHWAKL